MTSPELEELLARFFEGSIDEAGATRLEELLDADPAASERFKGLARVEGFLRARAAAPEAKADLIARVMRSLGEETRRRDITDRVMGTLRSRVRMWRRFRRGSRSSLGWTLWVAAAACAVVVAIVLHGTRRLPENGGVTKGGLTQEDRRTAESEPQIARAQALREEREQRLAEIERENARLRKECEEALARQQREAAEVARQALERNEAERRKAEQELATARAQEERAKEQTRRPRAETTVVIARLDHVLGEVYLLTPSGRTPAKAGQELVSSQGLQTVGAGSRAALTCPDSTRLDLGPGTTVRELSDANGKRIVLDEGHLTAEVAKQQAGRPMTIVTPQAEATVLGTRLSIAAGADSTRLEVTEGKVRLARNGKSIDVPGGHYAVAAAGVELVLKSIDLLFEDDFETCEPGRPAPGLTYLVKSGEPSDGSSDFQVVREGSNRFLQTLPSTAGGGRFRYAIAGEDSWDDLSLHADVRSPIAVLLVRWKGPRQTYIVMIDGNEQLAHVYRKDDKGGDGDALGLGALPEWWAKERWYSIRVQAVNRTERERRIVEISVRLWPQGRPEPATWLVKAKDDGRYGPPLLAGKIGLSGCWAAKRPGAHTDSFDNVRVTSVRSPR